MKEAQEKLRAAIEIDPADARPYRELMVGVLGPAHDIKGAREVMQEALANGAEPIAIEQALADAARTAGDLETAETALNEVTRDAPTLAAMMSLGDFYNETRRYDRATLAYEHATEIDPSSARAYFNLGQAEESAFDFAAASRDYARALQLAPDDRGIRQAYLDFQRRTAQSPQTVAGQMTGAWPAQARPIVAPAHSRRDSVRREDPVPQSRRADRRGRARPA